MTTDYPDDLTMTEARARYFADNGFGEGGGYDEKFVELKLGPVTIPFPNTKGRAVAVRYHDLHHLVTGYGTDFESETAISAWEIGAGCGTSVTAWLIDLSAMGVGLVTSPKKTVAAFVRGRRSSSLFGKAFEPLLEKTVGAVKLECRVPEMGAELKANAGDALALAGAVAGAAVAGPVVAIGTLVALPIGLAVLAQRGTTPRRTT